MALTDTPLYMQSHFRAQVKDTFEAAVQQTESKFSDVGMTDPEWKGKQVVFRTRQLLAWTETTGQRGGDTLQGEFQAGFRSGFKRDFEVALQFDRNDGHNLNTANLPQSEVQQDMRSGWNRAVDDVFLDAAQAQSLGGVDPFITPVALPSFMTIPVTWDKLTDPATTNTNLTMWKIQEGLKRMLVNDVDLDGEMTCLAISPAMKMAWVQYAQSATNDLFASLIAGWLKNPGEGLMGCKVVVTNRLKTSAGNVQAVLYTKRAFKTSPIEYDFQVDVLPGKRHGLQLAGYAKIGVVRRWDERVCLIWCDPTKVIVP